MQYVQIGMLHGLCFEIKTENMAVNNTTSHTTADELVVEDAHTEVATELHTEEAAGPLGSLGINPTFFVAQLVNFLIVVLVMWRFAYKPIVKMLDDRSKRIEESLKQADEVEKRVANLEGERDAVIREAKKQAAKILEEARTDAESRKNETVDSAKREVERVVIQGKGQLAKEKETMLREARKDIVEIAVAAATKILRDQVDERKAQSFAEEAVRKLT